MWGEPFGLFQCRTYRSNFNSLAPCGANPLGAICMTYETWISTHSPRVGRTRVKCCNLRNLDDFNSLAPCGANQKCKDKIHLASGFQLTRPVWGEPQPRIVAAHVKRISTHSPRVGRTPRRLLLRNSSKHFNSLAPCGANLAEHCKTVSGIVISTHSPRVGRTNHNAILTTVSVHFNSLAPCGANQDKAISLKAEQKFQLTRPVWGEPFLPYEPSICYCHFNSLAPCGANLYILYICRPFAATWGGQ